MGLMPAWRDALNRAHIAYKQSLLVVQYRVALFAKNSPCNLQYKLGYTAEFYEAYFGFVSWFESRTWLDKCAMIVVRSTRPTHFCLAEEIAQSDVHRGAVTAMIMRSPD